jgi:multidrug resistance efflux pump
VLFRVGDRGRSAVVRAPVAGTLAAVLAPVGTAVSAGETLAVLVPARRMEVVAMVSEDQIRLVHVGDTATVALASDPGHTIDGRVLAIWPLTAQTYIGQSGVPAPPAEEFLKQTALVPVAVSLDAMPSGTVSGGSAEVTIDVGS